MAELQSRIYLKPPNSTDLALVRSLFDGASKAAFIELAQRLNRENGNALALEFSEAIDRFEDLRSESVKPVRAIASWRFTLGIEGAAQVEKTLEFLLELIPGSRIWGYVVTDDDPVETWFKTVDEQVIHEENQPGQDEQTDRNAVESIYAWWHDGLPKGVFEGQLIESRDQVPKPRSIKKPITTTKITDIEDIAWENLFFNLIVNENDDLEPDWQNPGSEMTAATAEKALRLLRTLRANSRRCGVDFKDRDLSGSNGTVHFRFWTKSDSDLYPLNYAAVCALLGARLKQFATAHPDHDVHYLHEDGSVIVEKRQGKKKLDVAEYSIDQILEIMESDTAQ